MTEEIKPVIQEPQEIKRTVKINPISKEEMRRKLKYMRDKDRELVKGVFRFHEVPGGSIKFPFRAYKEDEVEIYEFTDGQVYTIPLGVARHLNKNCWYPVHSYEMDDAGKSTMRIGQKVHRVSFQSLEFVDIDEFPVINNSGIVTVEKVTTMR